MADPRLDPNFLNRYMVDVEDGPDTRQQFTLPAARAHRAQYERPGLIGHLVRGARDVAPPVPWDPDRPRPDLAGSQRSTTDKILDYGSMPAKAIAGVFNPPLTPPDRPVTGSLPPTERSQWEDTEYANRLRRFGLDTGLNMIGAGRLPGASPAGAIGTSGSAQTLRGRAGEQAWRTGTAEERLRTTNHPYGPGGIPIRDMPKPIIEGEKKIKSTPIDVEKDLKNAELIFMPGDATGAGGRLAGFEGMPRFENPVERLGGPGYSYVVAGQPGPRRLWASDKGPMTGVFNIAKGVEARGNVPWGVYMTGAKPYMDQSTQVVNTAIEAAKAGGVSKKMNDHLVDVMRSDWNTPADKSLLFPKKGLNDPSAVQRWLDLQPMPQHSKLVKAMGTAEAEKLGFPNMSVLRVGNTDPRLLTAQPGSAGLMLGRIDTSKGLITPSHHPDYNTAIATTGTPYTFGRQLPPEVIAQTMHQQRVNQIRPLRPGQPSAYLNAPHLYYGAGGTAQKTEPVTNQWRDTVQNWLANNPEQRIGGVVLGAGANDPRSVALAAGLNAVRDPQLGSFVRRDKYGEPRT